MWRDFRDIRDFRGLLRKINRIFRFHFKMPLSDECDNWITVLWICGVLSKKKCELRESEKEIDRVRENRVNWIDLDIRNKHLDYNCRHSQPNFQFFMRLVCILSLHIDARWNSPSKTLTVRVLTRELFFVVVVVVLIFTGKLTFDLDSIEMRI